MPIIPELSPTAGDNKDGFVDSLVQETLLTASMETVERCDRYLTPNAELRRAATGA